MTYNQKVLTEVKTPDILEYCDFAEQKTREDLSITQMQYEKETKEYTDLPFFKRLFTMSPDSDEVEIAQMLFKTRMKEIRMLRNLCVYKPNGTLTLESNHPFFSWYASK